jgi:hypothetical protein
MPADPRGTTTERGYGASHLRERRKVEREVKAGNAFCSECGRWIAPTAKWHLAHDHRNGGYAGAAHATCNIRERNKRHARKRRLRSRMW